MGRGKAITAVERGQIAAYNEQGLSIRQIADKLGRSNNLVLHCLKRGPENPPAITTGRKRKLSARDNRNICRHASNHCTTARKIIAELDLPVSQSTVLRTLDSDLNLRHEKMLKRPRLSVAHAEERRVFAHDHHTWTNEWDRVIFSDEKKFNLDGPDGWAYYWHDLRKEKRIFAKRQQGGGSVMIWLAFSNEGRTEAVVIDGNLTGNKYKALLQRYMIPLMNHIDDLYEDGAIFQQDNATPHIANVTLDWFDDKGVTVLDWPSR